MIDVIVVANGTSKRFGKNKLLEIINEEPVIIKTLKTIFQIENIGNIILVTNQEVIAEINKFNFKKIKFINGGETRSSSVYNGLQLVENDYVIIHDGARPFASKKIFNDIIKNFKLNDAVIPIQKIPNCLKKIEKKGIITLNRADYFTTQTPQGFKSSIIKKEYQNYNEFWFDDCQALETKNYKIKLIEGCSKNIKITYTSDLHK